MKKLLIGLSIFAILGGMNSSVFALNKDVGKTSGPAKIQDLDKPIMVSGKKSTVSIRLPANSTTGYQWYLTDYDAHLIKPKKYEYKVNSHKKGMVGVGGMAVFKMQVTKHFEVVPQMQKVTFTYARPWDLKEAGKTQTITILSSGR